MKKWKLEDYKALFLERAKSIAKTAAFNEVLKQFIEQEQPSNAELTKFYQHMRNKHD